MWWWCSSAGGAACSAGCGPRSWARYPRCCRSTTSSWSAWAWRRRTRRTSSGGTTSTGVLILLSLVSGVVLEAPYPASGWRPAGPAFDPTRDQTQAQQPSYLPPLDPRNPNSFDGVDVSVQGLPTSEQQIFQLSPINGQQYSGPSVNADVAKLNPRLQQAQYQQQQQIAREFARQRELEAAARQPNRPTYQAPGTFGQTTTAKPRNREETTEQFDLNEGETLEPSRNQPEKVTVEITKQNIQEYPAEVFLNPLSQLQVQGQFVRLPQFGQLQNGPVVYQQVQAEQGFDGPAHLAALPSVLAQRELFQQQAQFSQNPIVVQQEAIAQPAPQYQLNQYQPIQPQIQPVQPQFQPGQPQIQTVQYQPVQPQFQPGQYQPGQPQLQAAFPGQPQIQPNPYQPIQPQFPVTPSGQYQPQVVFQQSPTNQFQPANPDVEEIEPTNQQQPQIASYQPQFFQQPNQPIIAQPINYDNVQLYQLQAQIEQANQQGLQSGLDINQEGNDIEEKDPDEATTATAVATAFGTRTQPRVVAQYGVPSTAQRQPRPRYRTTTEAAQEETATEDGPAIAEATAVASGRRNARLRSRRVRPVFTLDKSGHLVLAQNTA